MNIVTRMLVTAGLLACTLAPALAQSAAPVSWISVLSTRIKPEMRQEYESFLKNDVMAAYKKAEVPWRQVWQPVFGDLAEYVSVTPLAKFAELDGPSIFVRALGEQGAERLLAKASSYASEYRRIAAIIRPDLSIDKPNAGPPKYAVLVRTRITPGRGPEYENWFKSELLPALKKAEVQQYYVSQSVFGAAPEMVTLTLIDKLAEIDKGPPTWRSLGREGSDKMMMKAAGMIAGSELAIIRYREDLSYQPTAKK